MLGRKGLPAGRRRATGVARIGLATVVACAGLATISGAVPLRVSAAVTSLTLTASPSTASAGSAVTLTATANENVGTAYIDVFDNTDGDWITTCSEVQSCVGTDTETNGGVHTYIAYVDNDPTLENPPTNIIATSNTATVNWIQPSSYYCPTPTLTVIDGTAFGVYTKLVAQVSPGQVALCVRGADGSTGSGGALVVRTDLSGFLPSVDGDATACQAKFVNENIGGVQVVIGSGSDPSTGATWLCAQVGGSQTRVVIPTTGAPPVAFYAD